SKNIYDMMKPNYTNKDVVKVMAKYAEKYQCNLPISNEKGYIPGVISYQISQYINDGYNEDDDEFVHRIILSRENSDYDFSLRETAFEENEVYAIDILMSTGPCKLNRCDETN